MNFRLTAILAAIAAVLGLLIGFWDRDDDSERARLEQARRAFRFNPARVDRLIIENGEGRLECALRGNRWHLVRPIAARADPVAIERLLDALRDLPRGDIILPPKRVADPYSPYGLDEPRARIGIIEGAVTNTILVGRRTPLGDGVFVRQTDHAGLVRVPTSLLDLLPAGVDVLRDHSLLDGSPGSIVRLDIRAPAGYIQLARDAGGQWRLFQPFSARADSAIVVRLIEQLLACRIVQFVQDAVSDLAPYGLDTQNAVTALLNTGSGDGSQMLAFGDPLPNAPHLVYARLQAENSVYAVPQSVRDALRIRPEDLRDRRIPGLVPESTGRIRVEENETVLEIVRDDDGRWQITAPIRAPASAEAVDALFRSWAGMRLTAFEETPPADAPPLARIIRLEPRDAAAAPVVLRLGPHPDGPAQTRIEIEGDSVTAVASPAALLDFPLDPLAYRSRDILSIPADDITSLRIVRDGQTTRVDRDPASGRWPPDAPWIERLLPAVAPLRADDLLGTAGSRAPGLDHPVLTVTLHLRGKTGLATTILVGDELSPGGPRRAAVRGRDLLFSLSPAVVDALAPPLSRNSE